MEFKIVFFATVFALFWDEIFLNIVSMILNKRLSVKFMLTWSIVSGLLMSLLVACHVPEQYRRLTIVMVGLGVLFSLGNPGSPYPLLKKWRRADPHGKESKPLESPGEEGLWGTWVPQG